MKRFFALTLLLLMVLMPAHAEILCDCQQNPCTCFLQLNDQGILPESIRAPLIEQGYLPKDYDSTVFDLQMQQAILTLQETWQLPSTGMLDDATLNCLLWDDPKHESKLAALAPDAFWVPTNGGIRVHVKRDCRGILTPRKISLENALALGIQPCGICAKRYRTLAE